MISRMSLQDVIFNWLTIQVVVDKKPNDQAAQETCEEFLEILKTDHHVDHIDYEKQGEMYIVTYEIRNEQSEKQYPTELAESLLNSIDDKTLYVPGFED